MKWIGSRVKYDKYDQNTESEADEFAQQKVEQVKKSKICIAHRDE